MSQRFGRLRGRTVLITTVLTFLTLVCVGLGLSAPLLVLGIPSFDIGQGAVWLLRWRNTVEESGVELNLLPLLLLAIGIGIVNGLRRTPRSKQ